MNRVVLVLPADAVSDASDAGHEARLALYDRAGFVVAEAGPAGWVVEKDHQGSAPRRLKDDRTLARALVQFLERTRGDPPPEEA